MLVGQFLFEATSLFKFVFIVAINVALKDTQNLDVGQRWRGVVESSEFRGGTELCNLVDRHLGPGLVAVARGA